MIADFSLSNSVLGKRYSELSQHSLRYARGSFRAADWLQGHIIMSSGS